MDKDVLIFCESYPMIKSTLFLATQNYENHQVTIVIPGWHDLDKFFELVNEKVFQGRLGIVHFDIYQGQTAKAANKIIKALYLLADIVRERRYLKVIFTKHFAHLREAEVFFFSRFFNPSTYYLLKELSKTNTLIYMPDPAYDAITINKAAPANIIELVHLARYKLVYGLDISLGKHPMGQKTTRMPDRFLRERVSRIIGQEERDGMLQDFNISQCRVFDSGDYSAMYFHDDSRVLTEYNYIADAEAFEKRLAEVFNVIGKYFPEDRVALKYHPGAGSSEWKAPLLIGKRLPDFIPAEFLYDDKIKIYLGITSMALANVEKGLAVSLIDMVNFKDDTIRERLKGYLIDWSRSEILFPKSMDEFERILVSISQ